MFFSETAAPATLQMSKAAQRQLSGVTLSSNIGLTFAACNNQYYSASGLLTLEALGTQAKVSLTCLTDLPGPVWRAHALLT